MPSFYSEEISPSQEEPIVLDLADGDILIFADNYMQGDNFEEHFGSCVITQSDPDTPVTAVINIVQAVDTVNITIEDIFIDASNGERAAIDIMESGRINLTLKGRNRVVSPEGHAGVMIADNEDTELFIRGEGSLEARGGSGGAGIGGGPDGTAGTVCIESGTVAAYGGEGAAGIEGGSIQILGGDVTAVGAAEAPCIGGRGVSGITLSGGTIRARRGPDGAPENVYDIGGHQDTEPVFLDPGEEGRAIVYVSGPDKIGGWDAVRESWNGIVWEGNAGMVYGAVDLSESGFTIEAGQTLEVPGDPDPAAEPVLTVTESGFRNHGTITGTGLVMMDGEKYRIEDNRLVSMTQEPPEELPEERVEVTVTGDPSKTYDGTAAVLPERGYTVIGSDEAVNVFYKARTAFNDAYTTVPPVNAGEYAVMVLCAGVSAEKAFTIRQAAPEAAVLPVSIRYDGAEKYTVELSDAAAPYLLTGDVAVYTLGTVPENKCLPADAVGIDGSALTLAPVPGGEAVVDIPVAVSGFTNYTPLALTVRVALTPEEGQQTPEPPPKWETPNDRPSGSGGAQGTSRPAENSPAPVEQDTVIKTAETVQPDGSKLVEMTGPDGTASTTMVSASGQAVTVVEISESAAAGEGAIKLPMPPVPSVRDAAQAPSVTVNGPKGAVVTVEIPVENAAPGTVAVAVGADGVRQVLRQTVPTESGVAVSVPTGTTMQIVDNGKTFADLPPEYWAGDAVGFVTGRELFGGTSASAFSPDQEMTRGMLMTVLARLDGMDTAGGQNWYDKGMAWAVERGVSSGDEPERDVTCEQMVTMLYRYAGSPSAAGSLTGFPTDAYSVSDYAVFSMDWAMGSGLLADAAGGLMVPKDNVTRAQAAVLLMRFVERAL